MSWKSYRAILVLVLAVVGGSCSFEPAYELRPGEPDPDREEMRRRMNIVVYQDVGGVLTQPDEPVTAADLAEGLETTCADNLATPGCAAIETECYSEVCDALEQICVANELLNLAQAEQQVPAVKVTVGTQVGAWTFPPQSPASNAAIAREAFLRSRDALNTITALLRDNAAGTCSFSGGLVEDRTPEPSLTVAESAAGSFVDAVRLATEATELEIQSLAAVADAQYSDQLMIARAARLAFSLEEGSRGAAARDAVGGANGLPASEYLAAEGFCPEPRLSPGASEALGLFRIAALPPREILDDDRTIQELLMGWGSMPAQKGLLARLSVLLSAPNLDPTASPPVTIDQFLLGFGLTLEDFVHAREHLANELRAFGRSLDALLPPQQVTAGVSTQGKFDLYASTRNPPLPPLRSYWSALVRHQPTWSGADDANVDVDSLASGDPDLALLLDAAATEAGALVADGDLDAATRAILAAFVNEGQERRTGRLHMCLWPGTTMDTVLGVMALGDWPSGSKVAVVRGHDGLQCAVRGSIEGAPCDVQDHILATATDTAAPATTGLSRRASIFLDPFRDAYEVMATPGSDTVSPLYSDTDATPAREVAPVFVVLLPAGVVSGPGAYRELGGAFVPLPGLGNEVTATQCYTFPIVPEAEDLAAEAIAPSTSYCAMASQSCAGVPLDQRIPLENELTSDSGGAPSVENSWRHYLDSAMRAAQQADQLGEDLIRSGLEMDMRAEAAIDELEDVCGVSINLDGLGALTSSVGTTCTGTCANDNYRCVRGQCVLDPVRQAISSAATDADRARLAACLGDESTTPWVTIGDQALCFWWDGSNPSTVCEGASENAPCPFVSVNGACSGDPPGEAEMIAAPAAPLGFFRLHDEPPAQDHPPDPANLPCAELAQLRTVTNPATRRRLVNTVLADDLFRNLPALQVLAERVTWRPAPGDFSSVRVDGSVWLSTGDPYQRQQAASVRWPCAQAPDFDVACPGGMEEEDFSAGPLFCNRLDAAACVDPVDVMTPVSAYGATRWDRARMNDMLARAVLAARIVTGVGLHGVEFPYYARTTQDTVWMINPDSAAQTPPHDAQQSPVVRNHGTGQTLVWYGGSGALRLDNNGGGGPVDTPLFDMSRGTLYRVEGAGGTPAGPGGCGTAGTTIPEGAEWSLCPYDLDTCVEVFDDAVDCDDVAGGQWYDRLAYDRNVGLIVRAFTDSSNGTDSVAASRLWLRAPAPTSGVVVTPPADALIERMLLDQQNQYGIGGLGPHNDDPLTRYWTRSWCGADQGCSHGIAQIRRTSQVCWTSTDSHAHLQAGTELAPECRDYVGCRGDGSFGEGIYDDCKSTVDTAYGLELGETFDGNRAFIAPRGLSTRDVVNGLELLCAAARRDTPGGLECGEAPVVETVGDLYEAEYFLQCKSAAIHNSATQAIFRNVPAQAVSLLQQGGAEGVYGAVGGEYAAATSDLRAAFIELSDVANGVGAALSAMAAQINALRGQIRNLGVQNEIADWQLASTTMNQVTECAQAAADAISIGKFPGGWGSAGLTCANSTAQIAFAARITDLEQEQNQESIRIALHDFERDFTNSARAMEGADVQLRASIAQIEAQVTRLQNLQRRGRRALSRALMLDSDPGEAGTEGAVGRQYDVNTVMRRRHNTLLRRYQEAQRNAVRQAFIAKLALEQRLGMPMDQMTERMTLLDEPPAQWHMDVCSMRGIDYDRIRNAQVTGDGREGEDADLLPPEDYAGEYLGDYVRRLELVFESYSFDYPFQDGTDTSVMSLRDEVLSTRGYCPVEVPNLLYEAGQLDAQATSSGGLGWERSGCVPFEVWPPESPPEPGAVADPPPNCVEPSPLALDAAGEVGPLPPWHGDFGAVGAYRIEFGQPTPPMWRSGEGTVIRPVQTSPGVTAVSYTEDTAWRQWVLLSPGRYRFSTFLRQSGALAHLVRRVTTQSGDQIVPIVPVGGAESERDRRGGGPSGTDEALLWHRYYVFFDVPEESWVAVGYTAQGTIEHAWADVAAPMLELVTDEVQGPSFDAAEFNPRPFFNTRQTRTRDMRVCEDTTGSEFRRTGFQRHCVGLCPDGYGECPGALEQHCYYETSFTLSPEALQRGSLRGGGGFAFGNFNYRVDNFGINLVGTGVRDCSTSTTPSTCYASGNVAYSVVHQGPYPVRNHRGHIYNAPLFTGRVERARALAAERYLTNPLSGADRSMVDPYLRYELRGRPLTGTYILRIWDDPGLAWENVEDIQVVLGYRYWTRQQ